MSFFLIIGLWSTLTLCFLRRAQVIGQNMANPATWVWVMGFIPVPTRPLKQLAFWSVELLVILFFYELFGISIVAHMTASVCGLGVMLALRERDSSFLEGLQLVPLAA